MPIHDWTRVDAGIYHGFHVRWVAHLTEALTATLSPSYYADIEHYADELIAAPLILGADIQSMAPATDVLNLPHATIHRTARKSKPTAQKQWRVVVRHVSGHRVVAHIEIVSPRNKDRRVSAEEFIAKGRAAIDAGVHLVVLDLFPPTRSARRGLAPGIWRKYDPAPVVAPPGQPLCLASVCASARPEGFFKFLAFGDELPAFPLFLTAALSVNLPLADTYSAAFAGSPPYLRELLSQPAA